MKHVVLYLYKKNSERLNAAICSRLPYTRKSCNWFASRRRASLNPEQKVSVFVKVDVLRKRGKVTNPVALLNLSCDMNFKVP